MMRSNSDFIQTNSATTTKAGNKKGEVTPVPSLRKAMSNSDSQNYDILLSNFQIKKKRYRVLLNYDHIVWERLKTKNRYDDECALKKDYGTNTNVVHINELIRIGKGNTKSAALHIEVPQSNAEFGADTLTNPQQQYENINTPPTEQYLALSYAARIINTATDCNRWEIRTLILYNADPYAVQQWYELLKKMLANTSSMRLRVRRLLVFINPYGGRKKGLNVYDRYCKPLFQLAGIDASCIISQRSNQIRDILISHDLTPFDAVCCVGGDGTVAEVINGLIFRAICDAGMDPRQPAYVPKPSIPIAIIPAGSTDTVAYSLHGTSDVTTAAIHLVLGQRRGMDICSIRNREGIIRFCASLLSYGYLGDIAAKSERYRWMGTKRYELAGFKSFLANNSYEAELRVLQQTYAINEDVHETSTSCRNSEESGVAITGMICYANCMRCNEAAENERKIVAKRVMANNEISANIVTTAHDNNDLPLSSNILLKSCNENSSDTAIPKRSSGTDHIKNKDFDKRSNAVISGSNGNDEKYKNESNDSIDKDENASNMSESYAQWKTINGKFFMISGANITCACTRSPNGLARYSHIGDGHLDLILVRKTSLLNNVRLLLNMMGRNGDIRNLPFVEMYRTKMFCFRAFNPNLVENYSIAGSCQPIASSVEHYIEDDDKLSHWNCDGEVISDQELTMISHCQLIDVFMRGPYTYKKPLKNNNASFFSRCCNCCKTNN